MAIDVLKRKSYIFVKCAFSVVEHILQQLNMNNMYIYIQIYIYTYIFVFIYSKSLFIARYIAEDITYDFIGKIINVRVSN